MGKLLDAHADALLQNKIREAPEQPGCYLFKNKLGYIIYVGKAKILHNRVKSYFTPAAAGHWRTAELVTKIADVEYRVTKSELDALLLEYMLIKQYKPWFNSQMKPDKTRPYLRVSRDEPYATLSSCDRITDDGADYYDFFIDEDDIKQTLALIGKVWGLPQCGKRSFKKSKSPCLYHSTDHCMAPCGGKADTVRYAAAVKEVTRLLTGKSVNCIPGLKREMRKAADNLAFERAAEYRGMLDGLRRVRNKSRLRFHLPDNGAVLILIRPHREKAFAVFYAVDRRVTARMDFPSVPDDALIAEFIASLENPNIVPEESEWLANCLVEVGAYKHFVNLPVGKSANRAIEKAIRQFSK